MSLSIAAPELAHARPVGLADYEYACLRYCHRVIGEYTALTIHLDYAELEGADFTRRRVPLPLWDRQCVPVDVLEQSALMMAARGVVLLDEWAWWPEESLAWARIGHRGPLVYGPELVRRTQDAITSIALVASAVTLGRERSGVVRDADHRLAAFHAWFKEQVIAHGWPWSVVDGPTIAAAALQAALIHPDAAFQRHCVALLEERVEAGHEPPEHLQQLRAVAQSRGA